MKIRNLVIGIAAGMTLLGAAGAVSAETITSADGVLSIETPSEAWTQKTDSKALLEISDGKNSITVEHLSNGETLPTQQVADEKNPDVYVSLISTKNEVFSVKGLAADNAGLQTVIQTAGTIKILKFDTKKAVTPAAPAAAETKKADTTEKKEETAQTEESETAAAQPTITAYDEGGMSVDLYYDAQLNVYKDSNGNTFLLMEYPVLYQPDSNSYWAADQNFWNEHSEGELNYEAYQTLENTDQEAEFVLYNEFGDSVDVFENLETGNCVSLDGSTFLFMSDGLFYEPESDTYWNTDPSYWESHDGDDMDYDEYVEDLDDADDYVDDEEVYDEDGEEDLDDLA